LNTLEKIIIAENPKTSPFMLDELADDKSLLVLLQVTGNPETTSSTLFRLSKHDNQEVLLRVGIHPSTEENTLKKMYSIYQYKWVNELVKQRLGLEKLEGILEQERKEL